MHKTNRDCYSEQKLSIQNQRNKQSSTVDKDGWKKNNSDEDTLETSPNISKAQRFNRNSLKNNRTKPSAQKIQKKSSR